MNKRPELVTNEERNDFASLRDDVASLTSNLMALTNHVKEHGVQGTRYVAGLARDKANEWQDAGRDGLNAVESRVKDRPTESLAIAFAAGIIASFLLGRK